MSFAEFQMLLAAVLVVAILAGLAPMARIARRTGHPRWLAVLMLVPALNLVLVCLFAARLGRRGAPPG
jgi:hypothetical protein